MNYGKLVKEIVGTYQKHGWHWRRVLLRPENRDEFNATFEAQSRDQIAVEEGMLDALWFSRPSYSEREAWELRVVSDNAFALFETFEKDETEEEREEMRREMEARLRTSQGTSEE